MEELICNCLLCLNPLKGPIIKMMDGKRTGGKKKKAKILLVNKGPSSQSYGFSSSHVWM